MSVAAWLAWAALAQAQPGSGELVLHATEHFELRLQGSTTEARRLGGMLETAWEAAVDLLGAQPALEGGRKLDYRRLATREAYRDAVLADGEALPAQATSAWWCPRNGVLYSVREEPAAFDRAMLVYGAVLQIHGLCEKKNETLDTAWYVHGLAQHLSVHRWDGERLELGVRPRVFCVDFPGRALAALGAPEIAGEPWDLEVLTDPYLAWALAKFAIEGERGRYRKKFEKLALGQTGSLVSGPDFLRSLGSERGVSQQFLRWLIAEQYPLVVATGEWEDRPDGAIVGTSVEGSPALCVAGAGVRRLVARIVDVQAVSGARGFVVGYRDPSNYVAGRVAPPFVRLETVREGQVVDLQHVALPHPQADELDLEVVAAEERRPKVEVAGADGAVAAIRLVLDGEAQAPFDAPAGRLGLYASGGQMAFLGVEAAPVPASKRRR